MGRGSCEGYLWGHGVRSIVGDRGEWAGRGCSADRWREKKIKTLLSDWPPSFHGALLERSPNYRTGALRTNLYCLPSGH